MKLLYLYSDSDFTPWRENINAATIASLIQATPENVQAFVTHFVGFTAEFADFLRQFDLIFNVCYGYGVADQVEVVRWLDWHGIKHTASSYSTQLLAMDKALLPDMCMQVGLNTPRILLPNELLDFSPTTTFIAKHRYGSLHRNMLFFKKDNIPSQQLNSLESYIIQPYIEGREFTVAVIPDKNGLNPQCLPPLEIIPNDGRAIYVAGQNYGPTYKDFEPQLDEHLHDMMTEGVLELHKLLEIKGMSRTDVRVANDEVYILDINTMPNLDPQRSYLPALANHHGIQLKELIERTIKSALIWYERQLVQQPD
ncbi:ATP-grasp domain-containing protein [Runella salmonicolor]|uniref:ATP-grasp domain-containing protein n=1 Tax=Runella salmonicolor TaxID=2950278 RepID=A0ABT1FXJ2_9BACT|nr:ATP-grasp domain-containing protein [Runella salmonicolor]MCP1386496.1 ATP-grasp domain-containing protein [Runella salmonicolor]